MARVHADSDLLTASTLTLFRLGGGLFEPPSGKIVTTFTPKELWQRYRGGVRGAPPVTDWPKKPSLNRVKKTNQNFCYHFPRSVSQQTPLTGTRLIGVLLGFEIQQTAVTCDIAGSHVHWRLKRFGSSTGYITLYQSRTSSSRIVCSQIKPPEYPQQKWKARADQFTLLT